MDITNRMKELTDLLNQASKAYYQEDKELISNLEYDRLYDELEALEKANGYSLPESPTRRVGYESVTELTKVRHTSPMLSLDKTKDVSKLKSFLGEQEGILSWKLDGLTIVLHYLNGSLTQAVTRGNGQVGEDVTHNARFFINLPKTIPYKGELILRGEAVIAYSDFEKINESLSEGEQYKNPRNLCSGSVRQLNSAIAALRRLRFYPFAVVNVTEIGLHNKKSTSFEWLKELGFDCVGYCLVTQASLENEVSAFKKKIESSDLASDGLVLTYDSIPYSLSMGVTSKFPKDSIAFKWADELRETKLLKVDWSTSRTGLINPVAVFEPVELEGTTVNRASLHNISIFEELKLGAGDRLTVYKANMIIPQVAANLTGSNTEKAPECCPSCGEPPQIIQQNEARCLYCVNPNCSAQLVLSLTHFTGRSAMNIEALSEATLEKFITAGFLHNYTDIYSLKNYEEEIKALEGFGEKSFKNLMASIERSREVELPNFIYALGIRQVGLSNAKLLCRHFNDDTDKILTASAEELCAVKGYGETISTSIRDYFSNENNSALFKKALTILRIKKRNTQHSLPLEGLNFVITGELSSFKNRDELRRVIEDKGGKVTGSVSAKTSFLINNDNTSSSSKNKKAAELNIPILTEDEFIGKFSL